MMHGSAGIPYRDLDFLSLCMNLNGKLDVVKTFHGRNKKKIQQFKFPFTEQKSDAKWKR